jgi:hypothetical protein
MIIKNVTRIYNKSKIVKPLKLKFMKRIVFMAVSTIFVACSGNKNESAKQETPMEVIEVVNVDSIPDKNGEYQVTDEVFFVLQEESENHFDNAKLKFGSKAPHIAAREIRKAVVYLTLEINKAKGDDRARLVSAKDKLNYLAERLEKKENVKEIEIRQAFYDANIALYRNYITQYDYITNNYNNEEKGINSYLDAAIQKVENADKWSSEKFDKETRKTIEDGKALSAKFKKDRTGIKEEWAAFRKKLKALDDKLEGSAID